MNTFRNLCLLFGLLWVPMALPTVAADHGNFTISSDQIYGHKAGMALTLDVVRPEQANGIGLLYMVSRGFVSNYFDLNEAMKTSQARGGRFAVLIDRGYTLLMVRHGSAPHFQVPDAVDDVKRATRYIRAHATSLGVDPDRLGVFGNSAGGHLALMLAASGDTGNADSSDPVERVGVKVAAVVAYYPPVDLRKDQWKDSDPIKRDSGPLAFDAKLQPTMSPLLLAGSITAPTLLIHGDQDKLVPLWNSQKMHAALQREGVPSELIVVKGAGHAFPGQYGRRAATALAAWFDRYLVADSKPKTE